LKSILKILPIPVSLLLASHSFALPCQSELRAARQTEIRGNPYASPYTFDEEQQIIQKDLSESIKRLKEFVEYTVNMKYEYTTYYRCILEARLNSEKSGDNKSDVDTVTSSVPGCPKYLNKSNIQWRRVGNPQLNLWEVSNVSAKTVKFTYRESGVNTSPDTLPPGQSTQVSTQSSTVPPYVVRDFREMMNFDRSQPQQKSLQCSLAIRPQ